MASNTNSLGFAVDHDGHCLEDVISDNVPPFAISGAVFAELFAGSGKDNSNIHLEAPPVECSGAFPSSSGGIPVVDAVTIEDYVSSDEEPPSPRTAIEMCKNNTSATVHAMMRTSKHEREELIRARRKLGDVLSFLKKQGFSEEMVIKDLVNGGFSSGSPCRDEFGLPKLSKSVDSTEDGKLKILTNKEGSEVDAHQVFEKTPKGTVAAVAQGVSNPFVDKMKNKEVDSTLDSQIPGASTGSDESNKKSWSQVVHESVPKLAPVEFDYIQLPPGVTKISPPVEVLKQGNDKFKLCLVGTFSKGFLPYAKVVELAHKAWDHRGLLQVSQKDSHTFLFKFKEINGMNAILARGTWFFERRPLILHNWGVNPCQKSTMPLWVKFEKIPDSYWTREGLSWLASSVGKPLCADANTSKLEVLPFAKLCVDYKIGDDLPTFLEVEVLDPFSEKIVVEKVLVSYPAKPLVCHACKSLGHLVGACPKVSRQWVRKEKSATLETGEALKDPVKASVQDSEENKATVADIISPDVPIIANKVNDSVSDELQQSETGWHEVKRKNSNDAKIVPGQVKKNSEVSHVPISTASSAADMPIFSALSRTMSKSQRKKAKRSGGKTPPLKN